MSECRLPSLSLTPRRTRALVGRRRRLERVFRAVAETIAVQRGREPVVRDPRCDHARVADCALANLAEMGVGRDEACRQNGAHGKYDPALVALADVGVSST